MAIHTATLSAQPVSVLNTYEAGAIQQLRDRGASTSLEIGPFYSVVEAHVTSGVAVRMLAPLGRRAIGKFKALDGNMVFIRAAVSPNMAARMLAAARPLA